MRKRKITIEKIKTTALFISLCTLNCVGYAQHDTLLHTKELTNRLEKTSEILQKCDAYNYVEFVEFNLNRIIDEDDFLLQFDGKNIIVNKVRIEAQDLNNFMFVGKNDNGDFILLSVIENDIQGVIETAGDVYAVETVGVQEYALIQVDYSKLQESCNEIPSNNNNNESVNEITIPIESLLSDICKIRVLVLYTPSAESSVSNIKNTILTAIDLTNESFNNSQINYQVELVYAGLTNYTEYGNIQMDLFRFQNKNDGLIDEVHWLRDKYSADICVLLVNTMDYCGVADAIGASENSSFCAVSTYGTCATSNYSFAHEIGHLLGCRHDPAVDNNTSPFAYGHGYISPSNNWRTIMAYPQYCNSCPRLLYWSNPNIVYGGVPMGTITTNHNARVWNERANTIMTFRQPDNNITISNSFLIDYNYGDVIAKQNIGTAGNVNINYSNSLYMRAGNEVLLNNGFWAQEGTDISAKISNICDCGTTLSEVEKVMVRDISDPFADTFFDDKYLSELFDCTIYPNPSKESVKISYTLYENATLSINLVNIFGQKIKEIQPVLQQQASSYSYQLNLSELPSGTYFLVFSLNHTIKTYKIVISK